MATITTRRFDAIAKHLADCQPFRTHGALRAETPDAAWMFARGYGRLPSDWARTLTARRDVVDYVVYSYATPIAWHDKEAGWIIPDEHYSVTTTRHQNMIRTAVCGYLHESYQE